MISQPRCPVISIVGPCNRSDRRTVRDSDHLSAIASPLNTGITLKFQKNHPLDREKTRFMLQRGEILGVIGPNGAGKTTLISLISGTLAPSSGDILFEGRSLIPLPAYRRARLGIGRTFQIMQPFPGLSVLDNVAVGALFGRGGGQAQLAKAREQARVQLDFVGLGKNVDQRADELGGPGRKRLELAKALAMQPKVLLCDEVMAGSRSGRDRRSDRSDPQGSQ